MTCIVMVQLQLCCALTFSSMISLFLAGSKKSVFSRY